MAASPHTTNANLATLVAAGTAPWLDQIRRGLITSGELARLRDECSLRGVTSNPTIFEQAILGSDDYDDAIAELAHSDLDAVGVYERLAVADLGDAADILRPVYDEPEFIVHTVWRQYGGWWDGNPATLKPAPERALAVELAALAGGPVVLADRALELLDQATDRATDAGTAEQALRLAGHLVEQAWLANPADTAVQAARQRVFAARAERATSTMARGVFTWAANESLEDGSEAAAPHTH